MAQALTKKRQQELVIEKFKLMENFLNKMEEELLKAPENVNINKISNFHGKASQIFSEISYHLAVFDKKPNIFLN